MVNLIEKNIKLVRLLSGEEIVCNIRFKDGQYVITDALAIILRENPAKKGQVGATFVHWMPHADHKLGVQVNKEYVGFVADPDKELLDNYKRIFSALLTPAKPALLLPQ